MKRKRGIEVAKNKTNCEKSISYLHPLRDLPQHTDHGYINDYSHELGSAVSSPSTG